MSDPHYLRERKYWDKRGHEDYISLSDFDQHRIGQWLRNVGDARAILDVGGGSGMTARLAPRNDHTLVVCTDISLEMLRHNRASSVQSDALQLPFSGRTFDAVIAAAFLHHLPGKEHEVLKECARILRPGGRIMGYDPSLLCVQNRIFMGNGPLRLNSFSPDERPIDPSELSNKLRCCGFTDVRIELFSFRNRRTTPFEVLQRWILNPLSIGPLRKYLQRWFLWSAARSD